MGQTPSRPLQRESAETEKRQDSQDDYYCTNDVNDVVHRVTLFRMIEQNRIPRDPNAASGYCSNPTPLQHGQRKSEKICFQTQGDPSERVSGTDPCPLGGRHKRRKAPVQPCAAMGPGHTVTVLTGKHQGQNLSLDGWCDIDAECIDERDRPIECVFRGKLVHAVFSSR
jgi:hypothetical protein